MRITKRRLRRIIHETINTWQKNVYHDYNDPFAVEDHPTMDLDINHYPNADGSWAVEIECGFDKSLSEPLRIFKTEEDASTYANKKEDIIYRAYLNSGEL
jgi:hypothetical protein